MKFRESQSFQYWEVKGMLLLLGLIATYRVIEHLINGADQKIWTYVIIGILLIISYLWVSRLNMEVVIGKKGIKYELHPLDNKHKIKWKDVESIRVVDASVASQFCGWNKYFGPDQKYASLVGRRGLQIRMKDGHEIFIGLKRPYEAADFIDQQLPHKPVKEIS